MCVYVYPLALNQQTFEPFNVDNWNDNCEAKSEAKSHRPLRGFQVDFSLTRKPRKGLNKDLQTA